MFTIIGGDHKEYGPVSAEEISQWIKDGRADGRTLAKRDGTNEWKPLASFPEFAGTAGSADIPPRFPGGNSAASGPAISGWNGRAGDFEIGDCLSDGWTLLMNNFGLLVGATAAIWLVALVAEFIPFAALFVKGVLYGGLYLVFLKRIRNQETNVGEAFAGFGTGGAQLLLAGLVATILTSIACCFTLPGIYLKIAWIFSLALVIDKRLEFWTAMELSRTVTNQVWLKVFILATVAFAPYILFQGFVYYKIDMMMYSQMSSFMSGAGMPDISKLLDFIKQLGPVAQKLNLEAQVVLLVNLPFATAALMFAYEALFGARPAKTS